MAHRRMMPAVDWEALLDRLAAAGWTARVVAAERLREVQERVTGGLASGELPGPMTAHLAGYAAFSWPDAARPARAVVVAATPRPLTRASLAVGGELRDVTLPPHYAGYHTVPETLAAALRAELGPLGYAAAKFEPPLKTLAAAAGLARYGRNNIAYVPGLGSYLMLAACATDAPPPLEPHVEPAPGPPSEPAPASPSGPAPLASWGDARQLDRCERCSACLRACPSAAIRADRFLLQTDRCLTALNEDEAPFPGWVDPAWHHCAVGCLRCQQACPENARVPLREEPAEVFDEGETAAILAATPPEEHAPATREKLARCGLDYSPTLIARNLHALLGV